MSTGRLEAFSDGVFAIIITIMVLELRIPTAAGMSDLAGLATTLGSYALSYAFVGIYWVNHHHLFQASERVDGRTLWANLHLLFWLSLVPFTTEWMREQHFAVVPVVMYGAVLWAAGAAFYVITRTLIRVHGNDSVLALALGDARKERLSMVLYSVALALAPFAPRLAVAVYVSVALIWFIPDRRIEVTLRSA